MKETDKKARTFLWLNKDERDIHLLNWDHITMPKDQGGLGICSARNNKIAMLDKLSWEVTSNGHNM